MGIPLLGLLGILEAGRGIAAPPPISGDWTLQFDSAASCASGPAGLQQPALSISQSGTAALITVNDGHATTLEATLDSATLTAKSPAASITASIAGQLGGRTLEGKMLFDGCGPVAFRALFQKIHQPQVMGEMVAGILLGPSLLGWLAPGASAALFPPASLGYLNALSQVGLVVFMFVVGLALDPSDLKGYGHAAVLTSHVSIVAPFCLGGLTALYLYPRLSDDGVTFTGFALFMGAAMSITAFPVLARILSERGLVRSKMGTLAIADRRLGTA